MATQVPLYAYPSLSIWNEVRGQFVGSLDMNTVVKSKVGVTVP